MKFKVITSDILDWILFGHEKQKKENNENVAIHL